MTSTRSSTPKVVIGVDVGGTNTDAVVLQVDAKTPTVLSSAKAITTEDVTTGIISAIQDAVTDALRNNSTGLGITQVNIGTTHFVNAVVQRKDLAKVCVVRLCGPASRKAPPFSDFPKDLENFINGKIFLVNGGYEFDGREISEVNEDEILTCITEAKELGLKNFVVSGIFSPLRTAQEDLVGKLVKSKYPESSVTLSNKIGHLGLLERENAAILNESLKPICQKTLKGFREALAKLNLHCPFYLTQNDGTIVNEDKAMEYPVCTFASGPTNSMRGSAFLSRLSDAIVVDIGGTTTDVGCLSKGFPREASAEVRIGGVRTNFQMPDVLSFGLGGGSYVDFNGADVKVGPLSCGYKIKDESLIFQDYLRGENVLPTATDIAVAAGICTLGNSENVKQLEPQLVSSAKVTIREMLETKIDQVKLTASDVPVVLVGGGSILIDGSNTLKGASEVVTPKFSDVANAVGAALSQISGTVDYVASTTEKIDQTKMSSEIDEAVNKLQDSTLEEKERVTMSIRKRYMEKARDETVSEAIEMAKDMAEQEGADPDTIVIMEKSDTPLAYLPGNAIRVKVKVVGELRHDKDVAITRELGVVSTQEESTFAESTFRKQNVTVTGEPIILQKLNERLSYNYEPHIDGNGEWILSVQDINCIAVGAGILGCGGGGNPNLGRLLATKAIEDGKKVRVITHDKLFKTINSENDAVVIVALMGAPTVIYEKLLTGNETAGAVRCMQDIHKYGNYENGNIDSTADAEIKEENEVRFIDNYSPKALGSPEGLPSNVLGNENIIGIMSAEIGGLNAIEPLLVSAELDLPTIDCDGMGRAFPELQMFCPFIYGMKPYPATLADEKGRRAVLLKCPTPKHLENHFRKVVVEMGASGGVTFTVLKKEDVCKKTILYSLSRAWRVGRAVMLARETNQSPINAIINQENGKLLVNGKVVDVRRETTGGFSKGHLKVEGIDDFSNTNIIVHFQNENLVARNTKDDAVLACTPDLITIVDSDTGEPTSTENIRYGMRISVLALPIPDVMKTEAALKVVGPQAFGYADDVVYSPVGKYVDPNPVGPK